MFSHQHCNGSGVMCSCGDVQNARTERRECRTLIQFQSAAGSSELQAAAATRTSLFRVAHVSVLPAIASSPAFRLPALLPTSLAIGGLPLTLAADLLIINLPPSYASLLLFTHTDSQLIFYSSSSTAIGQPITLLPKKRTSTETKTTSSSPNRLLKKLRPPTP